MRPDLPIYSELKNLCTALTAQKNVILTATPGAGKSTVVPLHLLQNTNLSINRIILVQPRRLAVKSVANRLASSLGEKVGLTVGYRMRMDTQISKQTKIEVVTEGVLLRQLQHDPELSDIDLIIFDEVHERSLTCDLCLSLCLDIQHGLREDLQLLAMSATVDASIFESFLPHSVVVHCNAPMFPVAVHYRAGKNFAPEISDYLHVAFEAHKKHDASILIFLPGVREIHQLERQLLSLALNDTEIVCLYGGLSIEKQQRAVQIPTGRRRKIVLATSIAETSLTIEGIGVVIDGGQNRYQQYNSTTGMNSLQTGKNAKAGADQRKGRAGRLGPGDCYRLWSQSERREPFNVPEILTADLVPLALDIAQWGVLDESELSWLTPPPAVTLTNARELLVTIGAIDEKFRITTTGKRIQKLGLHPRIGKMLCLTTNTASFHDACLLATVLNESGSIRVEHTEDDLEKLLDYCKSDSFSRSTQGVRLKKLERILHKSGTQNNQGRTLQTGEMLALAYPDRIAQKRKNSRDHFRMANGRGAVLTETSALLNSAYIVISELDSRKGDAKVFQAAPITQESIEALFEDQVSEREVFLLDETSGVFIAELQTYFKEIVLSSRKIASPNTTTRSHAICRYIRKKGLSVLNWSDECRTWQARVNIIKENFPDLASNTLAPFPDVDDAALINSLQDWLEPWLNDISTIRALQRVDLIAALNSLLSWEQQKFIKKEAPTHFRVASGSKIKLDYIDNAIPILAARLQELFSTKLNPSICSGRQPLLIHLLSPGRRPVQITSDLAGFWRTSYNDVKKEMKGRYPKHHWPDDPANTEPHSTVRPK